MLSMTIVSIDPDFFPVLITSSWDFSKWTDRVEVYSLSRHLERKYFFFFLIIWFVIANFCSFLRIRFFVSFWLLVSLVL